MMTGFESKQHSGEQAGVRKRLTFRPACAALTVLLTFTGIAARAADQSPSSLPADWITPKTLTHLAPHPRLFVSPAQIQRMVNGRGKAYADDYKQVAMAADQGVRDQKDPLSNPALYKGKFKPLQRSFWMFGRLVSLADQWHITHDRRYLNAAVKNIEAMKDWLPPDGSIDLWQGQEITAIAITYDLIYNDLNPAQRKALVQFARIHCIDPFLRQTEPKHHTWWYGMVINWNPVCCVGAGMLALTTYEDIPESQTVIDRVNKSLKPIFDTLQKTHGGWYEGLGYWNWTVHYLSLYCMSYQRATGKVYPPFHSAGFRETLLFGSYFVPYGEECGFGDNEHGHFSSSLTAAAEMLGDKQLVKQLQDYHARFDKYSAEDQKSKHLSKSGDKSKGKDKNDNISYSKPLELLIKPDPETRVPAAKPQKNFVSIYPNLGWAVIADQWPRPSVYASVRGGPLGSPGSHAHDNLLSWNGVVGTERMIVSYHRDTYYGPSFGGRAWDIYERSPRAKNTIFIAGLALGLNRRGHPHAAETTFQLPVGPALRLDASSASRYSARFVCRLFVVLGHHGLLVLDRVEGASGPVEVRTHTMKKATFGNTDVLLKGQRETARMTFAADQPCVLHEAKDLLTDPRATPPTMMRWQTVAARANDVTMASLLTPGSDPVDLTVQTKGKIITVTAKSKGWSESVRLTTQLKAIDGD